MKKIIFILTLLCSFLPKLAFTKEKVEITIGFARSSHPTSLPRSLYIYDEEVRKSYRIERTTGVLNVFEGSLPSGLYDIENIENHLISYKISESSEPLEKDKYYAFHYAKKDKKLLIVLESEPQPLSQLHVQQVSYQKAFLALLKSPRPLHYTKQEQARLLAQQNRQSSRIKLTDSKEKDGRIDAFKDLNAPAKPTLDAARISAESLNDAISSKDWLRAEDQLQILLLMEPESPQFNYSLGYVHTQNKKCESARAAFTKIALSGELKANSEYHLGLCYYHEQQYETASSLFEMLSKEPSAPTQIKDYAREMFQKTRFLTSQHSAKASNNSSSSATEARPYGIVFNLDVFQYDSNVLAVPGSLAPVATQGGMGSGGNILIYGKPLSHEDFKLSLNYVLSGIWHPNDDFINYDLWSHTFSAPIELTSKFLGENTRWGITPGVSFLQSQTDGVRSVPSFHEIMTSYFLQNQISRAPSADRLYEVHFNLREDLSYYPITEPENNATGPGFVIGGSFTKYLNANRKHAFLLGSNLEVIVSQGKNFRQLKPSIFGGYSMPLSFFGLRASSQITVFYNDYFTSLTKRQDKVVKVDLSLLKDLSSAIYVAESFSLTNSFSSNEIGDYLRFVMTSSINMKF